MWERLGYKDEQFKEEVRNLITAKSKTGNYQLPAR